MNNALMRGNTGSNNGLTFCMGVDLQHTTEVHF